MTSRHRPFRACLWAFACATLTQALHAAPPPVLELQARLFFSGSGGFSQDLLAPDAPAPVNVVAEADPSTATLVTVLVRQPEGSLLPSDSRVRLVVREAAVGGKGERIVLDRTLSLGVMPEGGAVHLGFWVQGTGCRPLLLQARLTPARALAPPAAAQARLPFACGE
jgi:hypothetical protein